MARLVSRLCGASEGRQAVAFEPGSVACLERRDEGAWALAWMIRPELVPGD